MNIEKTITVNISEEELKKIVAEYVEKETKHKIDPENVKFPIGQRTEGDGWGEHYVHFLKGCVVTYKDN